MDSVDTSLKMFDPKSYYIWVNDKEYKLLSRYYFDFIRYVEKGDSIYNEMERWDIYVY